MKMAISRFTEIMVGKRPAVSFSVFFPGEQMFTDFTCYSGWRVENGCIKPPYSKTSKGNFIKVGTVGQETAEKLYGIIKGALLEHQLYDKYPLAIKEVAISELVDMSRVCGLFPRLFMEKVTAEVE